MQKFYIIIFFSLLNLGSLNAHATWEKLFGLNSTDVFRCVREVPAGGYILAGYTANFSSSDSDGYVVRLNTMGDTIWTFRYNAPLSRKDIFYKVICTADKGFMLCGYSSSVADLTDDIIYLKLDSMGVQQWVKFWGGPGKDRAQDIVQTNDGNYAIAGYTTSPPATYYDGFLLKINSNGDTLWSKRYGGGLGSYDDVNCIKELADGGFIMGGQSQNLPNGFDMFLIRANSSGQVIWTKKIGTPQADNIESLCVLADGFILAGSTTNQSAISDGYLVKTDTSGNMQWDTPFGGIYRDDIHSVERTSDNGFIMAGTTSSLGAGPADSIPHLWLLKSDSSGNLQWQKWFGGIRHDHGYSAQQTSDGGYILAGHSGSFGYDVEEDAIAIKTDLNGNVDSLLTYTSVYQLLSPVATNCGGANTQIILSLKNFGNAPIANIPVTVEVTGTINQTFNQTFSASSDTVIIGTINTSGGGTYTFNCFTNNNNDVCPKRNGLIKTIIIEGVNPAPIPSGSSRCGPGTVPLFASANATIYWYNTPTGGTSIHSGPSFTSFVSSTTTYYIQTGLNCPSSRVPIVANIYPIAQDPVTTGNSHCGPDSIVLSAVSSDPISWFASPSGGTAIASGNSYTTPVINITTTYYAQAINGTCSSNRMPAIATIGIVPNDPVPMSGSHCGPGTVLLTASSPDLVNWYDTPTGGVSIATGTSFTTPFITANTPYYVESNNGGCISNRIGTTAFINAIPTIYLGPDITVSGTSHLIDAGPGFIFYGWSTGASSQSIIVTTPSTYCVTVIDSNNCVANDCISVDFITGISDAGEQKLFSVYPNPTNGIITVDLSSNKSYATVELINITGDVILTTTINQSSGTIDLSSYAKGLYFLKLNNGEYQELKKIIIE